MITLTQEVLENVRIRSLQNSILKEMDLIKKQAISKRYFGQNHQVTINQGMGFHALIKHVGVGSGKTLCMTQENEYFHNYWKMIEQWFEINHFSTKIEQFEYEKGKALESHYYVLFIYNNN